MYLTFLELIWGDRQNFETLKKINQRKIWKNKKHKWTNLENKYLKMPILNIY